MSRNVCYVHFFSYLQVIILGFKMGHATEDICVLQAVPPIYTPSNPYPLQALKTPKASVHTLEFLV